MKGPSTRKIVAALVVAVPALVGGIAFWINASAARRFEHLEREVKGLHQEALLRDTSRPPRPGVILPGNSWTEYQRALAAVRDDSGVDVVTHFVRGVSTADPEKARQRVAADAATLDFLRSGARRKCGNPNIPWERAPATTSFDYSYSIILGDLAAAGARFVAKEGRVRDAAELLLDGCQFARDLCTNSIGINSMASMEIYGRQLSELRDLLLSRALLKEDLVELSGELETADRSFPGDGLTPRNEMLFTGYSFLNSAADPNLLTWSGGDFSRAALWRSGFSVRLAFASAFEEVRTCCDRATGSETLPWRQARTLLQAVDHEAMESQNPVVASSVPLFMPLARSARERRAQLRLLRAAAAWHVTGEIPPLDDPLGTTLRHAEKDGTIRVWSVGRDGTDHGGVGSWKLEAGKDILLEWKR